jgi:hypothetical protein
VLKPLTDKTEEWQNSNVCEVGFQQNTHNVHATAKRKHEEEGGEVIIIYGGDKNEIHTAVRRSINSSQKTGAITNYISQSKCQLCVLKKVK